MGKYTCPYCGETEKIKVRTETEEGLSFDVSVRCLHCGSAFNHQLCYELQMEQDGVDRTVKRRRSVRNQLCVPDELIRARHSMDQDDEKVTARLFAECFRKYPHNWEAVFYNAYYTVLTNTAIQNITYYKIFAVNVRLALHLASDYLSGEMLKLAVEEISMSSASICYEFRCAFKEVADDFLIGKYPDAQRLLVSMDTDIIYDCISEFLLSDTSFYESIINSFENAKIGSVDIFGSIKREYIEAILEMKSNPSWFYPLEYADSLNKNKSFVDLINIRRDARY